MCAAHVKNNATFPYAITSLTWPSVASSEEGDTRARSVENYDARKMTQTEERHKLVRIVRSRPHIPKCQIIYYYCNKKTTHETKNVTDFELMSMCFNKRGYRDTNFLFKLCPQKSNNSCFTWQYLCNVITCHELHWLVEAPLAMKHIYRMPLITLCAPLVVHFKEVLLTRASNYHHLSRINCN